jgi:hypothetical protein
VKHPASASAAAAAGSSGLSSGWVTGCRCYAQLVCFAIMQAHMLHTMRAAAAAGVATDAEPPLQWPFHFCSSGIMRAPLGVQRRTPEAASGCRSAARSASRALLLPFRRFNQDTAASHPAR